MRCAISLVRCLFSTTLVRVAVATSEGLHRAAGGPAEQQTPLAGTEKLTLEGDIASQMIDGIDQFLLRKLDESVEKRERHWKRDFSSPEAYANRSSRTASGWRIFWDGARACRFQLRQKRISTPDVPPVAAEAETYHDALRALAGV